MISYMKRTYIEEFYEFKIITNSLMDINFLYY